MFHFNIYKSQNTRIILLCEKKCNLPIYLFTIYCTLSSTVQWIFHNLVINYGWLETKYIQCNLKYTEYAKKIFLFYLKPWRIWIMLLLHNPLHMLMCLGFRDLPVCSRFPVLRITTGGVIHKYYDLTFGAGVIS